MTYFDQAGEPSDAPGRFVNVDDLEALTLVPGLEFRPLTTESVMTNFVTFEANCPRRCTTTPNSRSRSSSPAS